MIGIDLHESLNFIVLEIGEYSDRSETCIQRQNGDVKMGNLVADGGLVLIHGA